MAEAIEMTRVLKMGATELPFPNGMNDPREVMRIYAANFPHLAQASLSEPEVEGDRLVYRVEKAPVKTKG